MYLADTFARRIDRLPYGPGASVHDRQSFVAFEMSDCFPDGSCIDSEGALWNAQFEGGTVRRFLPDGTLDAIIHVDAPQVTCCCFGGPDLHTMFITTARENMDATRVAQHPHSGHVFSVQLPFRGLPESILAFCVEL